MKFLNQILVIILLIFCLPIQAFSFSFQDGFYKNEGFIQNKNVKFYALCKDYAIGITNNGIYYYFLKDIKKQTGVENITSYHPDSIQSEILIEEISFQFDGEWELNHSLLNEVPIKYYKNGSFFNQLKKTDTIYYVNKKNDNFIKIFLHEQRVKYDIVFGYNELSSIKILTNADLIKFGNKSIEIIRGDIRLVEHIPLIIDENGNDAWSDVKITTNHKNQITYTKLKKGKKIIIDPVEYGVKYGTYYGGNSIEYVYKILADNSKNIYIVGFTLSPNNIATPGAYLTFQQDFDVFIAKFNPNGQRLWATYFGGPGYDRTYTATVDDYQNIIVCGNTMSSTGIATVGSHQDYLASTDDAFIVRFNSNGQLLWSTYYGGNNHDFIADCFYKSGKIYITGHTRSNTNIVTPGAFKTTFNPIEMAFWSIFDTTGTLLYGTYYGNGNFDEPWGIRVDASSNVYVCGYTKSATQIATSGGYQTSLSGSFDGFLSKWNSSGQIIWGTYFGGASMEQLNSMDLDENNNIYIIMESSSTSGLSTPGSHQPNHGGTIDGVLAKFNTNGQLQWSTYIGGSLEEYLKSLDYYDGKVYIFGHTYTSSTLTTIGAFQPSLNGGYDNVFLIYNQNGNKLFGSYLGGSGSEYGYSIFVSDTTHILVAGFTSSTSQIIMSGAHQTTYGGGTSDGFFNILCRPSPLTYLNASGTISVCDNELFNLYTQNSFTNYLWNTGSTTNSIPITNPGFYFVNTIDGNNCPGKSDTVFVNFYPTQHIPISAPQHLCQEDSVQLVLPSGFIQYQWNNGQTSDNIWINDNQAYCATLTDINGCNNYTDTVQLIVPTQQYSINVLGDTIVCIGDTLILSAPNNLTNITWNINSNNYSIGIDTSGFYWFNGIDSYGCNIYSDTIQAIFINHPDPIIGLNQNGIFYLCTNDVLILTADSGFVSYNWSNGFSGQSLSISQSGSYFVTAIDSNGCITHSDTAIVFASPISNVSVFSNQNIPACPNQPLVLSAHPDLLSILWNTNDTTFSILVNQNSSIFYQGLDTFNCVHYSDTLYVSFVDPLFPQVITNPVSPCQGMQVMGSLIGLNSNGNYLIYWNNSNTNSNIIHVYNDTTLYATVIDNTTGCIWISDSVQVVFDQPINPILNYPDSVCVNQNALIQIQNATSFVNIIWSNNQSGPTGIYNSSNIGYLPWTVQLIDWNGCTQYFIDSIYFKNCFASTLHDLNDGGITVFPNPFNEKIRLFSNVAIQATIKIYDEKGKLIILFKAMQLPTDIFLDNLAAGVYYLKVVTELDCLVLKILKI